MKIIFEDNENSILARLIRKSYSSEGNKNILFVSGNSNIYKKSEELIGKEEMVVVYLDTVPNNENIINIYGRLKRLSKNNEYKLVVLPIPCAEYYYIRHINRLSISGLITDKEAVETCINRDNYFELNIVKGVDFKGYKTFERFCKLVANRALYECTVDRKDLITDIESHYHWYCEKDCLCKVPLKECISISCDEKSNKYIMEYPCVPFLKFDGYKEVSKNDIWDIHRRLVDEYNKLCDEILSHNIFGKLVSCKKIDYIR